MYSSLSIENFRGIQSLRIDSLQRINLVVGRNNAGKTSLLEAAILLGGGGNSPNVALSLGQTRGQLVQGSDEIWRALFRQMAPEHPVRISGIRGGQECAVTIEGLAYDATPVAGEAGVQVPVPIATLREDSEIGRLRFVHHMADGRKLETMVTRDPNSGGIRVSSLVERPAIIPTVLVPASWPVTLEAAREFSALRESRREADVVRALQSIDPRIKRVEVLLKGMVPTLHLDLGLGRLLPLAVAGAGVVRLFMIALKFAIVRGGLLLVDEIENGLHHSVIDELWKFVANQAEAFDVQVIATTHSDEMMRSAARCQRARSEPLGLFRLDLVHGEHRAACYNDEALQAVLESNFEVRA